GFNVAALATLVKEIDPITMTALLILTAGIMVLVISKIMCIFRLPTKAEWKTIGLITIFNVVLHHSFLAMGLTKTADINAGIILVETTLLTMIISIIFLRNSVSTIRIIGIIAGIAGILFTSLAGNDSFTSISSGDGYFFLCMVAQAISFFLIGRVNPTFD